jgi:HAD superfamily hydrolase (TIGR01509 family)
VFDLDGTLAESEAAHERALRAASETIGITFTHEYFRDHCVGVGERACFRMLASEHGIDLESEDVERLVASKLAAFLQEVGRGAVQAYPGAADLVRRAASRVPIAVCSGSNSASVSAMLEAIGIAPVLSAVVTSDDISRPKPDPEAYLLAAARLGARPSRCVAIEDSPTGIESARRAGLRVVAVAHSLPRARLVAADALADAIAHLDIDDLLAGRCEG